MGQYAYSSSESALYVHQYVGGAAKANVGGAAVTLTARTDYPWDGTIDFALACAAAIPNTCAAAIPGRRDEPAADAVALEGHRATGVPQFKFDLMLRIPAWCGKYKLAVNGKAVKAPVVKGYAKLRRAWQSGDTVQLVLDMPVQRVAANPQVMEADGKVALQRGPILFCLEQTDNAAPVGSLLLPDKAKLTARFDKNVPGRRGGHRRRRRSTRRQTLEEESLPARRQDHIQDRQVQGHPLRPLGQPPTRRDGRLAAKSVERGA